MTGTIVCGVTPSPEGRAAAEVAAAVGARLGLRLVLVHVLPAMPRDTHESMTARQGRAGGERLLSSLAAELEGEVETRLLAGERAEGLAQVAAEEGADLVVVGARRAGLGGRRLASSLARDLESATPVPVLVAPPSTRRRSARRLEAVM
jgi:nucleotide-binding universal stress UspA family protein